MHINSIQFIFFMHLNCHKQVNSITANEIRPHYRTVNTLNGIEIKKYGTIATTIPLMPAEAKEISQWNEKRRMKHKHTTHLFRFTLVFTVQIWCAICNAYFSSSTLSLQFLQNPISVQKYSNPITLDKYQQRQAIEFLYTWTILRNKRNQFRFPFQWIKLNQITFHNVQF